MSNTPTPPIKLVIGLESHMLPQEELEKVQLVTADGEHFALIEQYPLWENADLIIKAVNSHDALVAALVGMITAYELGNEDQLRTEVTDASAALEKIHMEDRKEGKKCLTNTE